MHDSTEGPPISDEEATDDPEAGATDLIERGSDLEPPRPARSDSARMLLIRHFEVQATKLYERGDIPRFLQSPVGRKATAVGACWPLSTDDVITSTQRGQGHCLARAVSPRAMMAEVMARQSGTNRGFGGSMHIADLEHGVCGADGIVAAGVPCAVGAATAVTLRGQRQVAVAVCSDGAVVQGAFHEGSTSRPSGTCLW